MRRILFVAIAAVMFFAACSKLPQSPTVSQTVIADQHKAELPASVMVAAPAAATTVALQNNVAVTGLSDVQGGVQYFTIAVPSGQTKLVVKIAGNSGDCDLYVKFGAAPTTTTYDYRPYTNTSNETITAYSPAAGTWYVMLRGYTAYSGLTLIASYDAGPKPLPDLTVWMASASPYVETHTFTSSDCPVIEGDVVAGTRRLLRFSTEARNSGGEYVLGDPSTNPLVEYDSCDGHYEMPGFAKYSLYNSSGQLVAGGQKTSFCIEDFNKWDPAAGPPKFTCSYQGISNGWADTYPGTLNGQWIDITDLPGGTYTLEIIVDPDNKFVESNETNNTGRMTVTIPPATNPTVTPLVSSVPVTGLSGSKGSLTYYKITVPSGTTLLSVTTSGGSGDCDLYLKYAGPPSTTNFDFRSWGNTNSESVSATGPTAGDWYIALNGYAAYSGVTLVATVTTAGSALPTLQGGVPVTNLAGAQGSVTTYKITVPPDAPALTVTTSGGTGDCDLYVKYGTVPTTSSFDYRSWTFTTNESFVAAAPRVGDWYVTVYGYAAYSGVTLLGTFTFPAAPAALSPVQQPLAKH